MSNKNKSELKEEDAWELVRSHAHAAIGDRIERKLKELEKNNAKPKRKRRNK